MSLDNFDMTATCAQCGTEYPGNKAVKCPKQSLKEANKLVGERHDKELERFQVPTAL